ncbi:MAG: type II toxin-antitoxin system RelE/ParE family toxin [Robiginitomaculum sp.]|nr:type II toxin-antitoxin system RelE/ParE family toxin [Robiginitomaculum sp.]MDQ7077534.1 type II toxin-antitoxin system RelE/ParE family toxin [Robiginitomaculum sp.]
MIKTIKHKGLKLFYEKGDRSKLPADMIAKIIRIMTILDEARDVEALDRPALRLHKLTGNRKGEWSVTVRANWRIVFSFTNGNVYDLDFVDYH